MAWSEKHTKIELLPEDCYCGEITTEKLCVIN
jgi:hypothetical protein